MTNTKTLTDIKQDLGLYETRVRSLKTRGRGFRGFCPLHNDEPKPSFDVDWKDGALLWVCRAGCGGGTIIDLEVALTRCDGSTAIRRLTEEVESGPAKPLEPPAERKPAILKVTPDEVEKYAAALTDFFGDELPEKFLKDSGITGSVAEALQLGFKGNQFFGCHSKRCSKCGEYPALVIPLYWNGQLVGLKYRNLDAPDKEHKWTQETGSKSDFLWLADQKPVNPESNVVAVFEGIRDTALALSLGFNAVGLISASSVSRNPSERFRDSLNKAATTYRHALLIGDRDMAGMKAKVNLFFHLRPGASFSGVPYEYGDLSEFYEKAGSEKVIQWLRDVYDKAKNDPKLGKLVHSAPSYYLVSQKGNEVKTKKVEWLWDNRIAKGKLTLFSGNPGVGKSTVVCHLIARVTTGKDFPTVKNANPAMNVAMLCAEDDLADTLVPRLQAAGADLERVHLISRTVVDTRSKSKPEEFSLDTGIIALENTLRTIGDVGLFVVDPLNSYLSKTDVNKANEVRRVLGPVNELALKTGVAFVILVHFNKRFDVGALGKVSGSTDLTAACRAVYTFSADSQNPGQYLMAVPKNNLSKVKTSLTYRLEDAFVDVPGEPEPCCVPKVVWGKEDSRTADQILSESQNPLELKSNVAVSFLQ